MNQPPRRPCANDLVHARASRASALIGACTCTVHNRTRCRNRLRHPVTAHGMLSPLVIVCRLSTAVVCAALRADTRKAVDVDKDNWGHHA